MGLFKKIRRAVSNAVGGVGGFFSDIGDIKRVTESRFLKDPFNTLVRNIGDLGERIQEIEIPGTGLSINAGSNWLESGFAFRFPADFFFGYGGDSNYNGPGANPYRVQLKVFLNEQKYNKTLFKYVPSSNTVDDIKNYFRLNPTYGSEDICVPNNNTSLKLVFNDTNFNDNDGVINVQIIQIGADEECNCKINNDINLDIAVGFTNIDNNLVYPVSARGMCYVGTKNGGLSTGGRCENNTMAEAEQKLLDKYNSFYKVEFDETEVKADLEKARILDLVYEYTGSTWIRRQNLIESVYYHTGVGDQNNSLFFGGLHDSMTSYSFSYNDMSDLLDTPSFKEWDCTERKNIVYTKNNNYGKLYPHDLNQSSCWETPTWSISSNFNISCIDVNNYTKNTIINIDNNGTPDNIVISASNPEITNGCMIIDDPTYIFSKNKLLSYVSDNDFPQVNIIGLSGNTNVYKYPFCVAISSNAGFDYPNNYSLIVKASNISGGSFYVKCEVDNISGNGVKNTFNGTITFEEFEMKFIDKFFIYPNDIYPGSFSLETKEIFIREINTNENGVNILGSIRHGFKYKSIVDGTTDRYYGTYGIFVLYFDDFSDIITGLQDEKTIIASQALLVVDSSTFINQIGSYYGEATAKFKVDKRNAVMVGVNNAIYDWNSSYEVCGSNIVNSLNISGSFGNDILRWGTPLWAESFAKSATLLYDLKFNSKKEFCDSNYGNILHEITDIKVRTDSIMSLINKRANISGNTRKQEHNYKALNDTIIKSRLQIKDIIYTPTEIGSYYEQESNFNITNTSCIVGFIDDIVESSVSGTIISKGAACCSGSRSFPSNDYFINRSFDSTSSVDKTLNIYYDFYDSCNWKIKNASIVPSISANLYDYSIYEIIDEDCIHSCYETVPETAIEFNITSAMPAISAVMAFPNEDYYKLATITGSASHAFLKYYVYDATRWHFTNEYTINTVCYNMVSSQVITSGKILVDYPANASVWAMSGSRFTLSGINTCCSGCSGMVRFPEDFNFVNTTYGVNGFDRYSTNTFKLKSGVLYNPNNQDDDEFYLYIKMYSLKIGDLNIEIDGCKAGSLTIEVSACPDYCEYTNTNNIDVLFTAAPSGQTYAEYATSFIQEYRSDSKFKVSDSWKPSNDYNISQHNTGLNKKSKWKRYNDGVGMGGDVPDYDTIYNIKAESSYPINQWNEINEWYIGQMAFGTPQKCVVVGGHKIDKYVSKTLIGSGLHAAPTTNRIFVWDQTFISPEDSYLKNYYAKRFNTYYTTTSERISSNQNLSSLSCTIFDAESDIVVERVGNIVSDGSTNIITVTFDTPMPEEVGADYQIVITPDDNIKVWWENKSSSGFTIKIELNNWKGNIDYLATTVIKVKEDDILQKGNNSGYIFEK